MAVLYLAVALYAVRAVLPRFSEAFPETLSTGWPGPAVRRADQALTAWAVARNARTLLVRPWRLFDWEQCHPADLAGAFGHLLLGESLLGLGGYWLSGDPIVAYNVAFILSLLLPALAMFALVRYWTGSLASGFIAGLLFAFHPPRVASPENLFSHSNISTPLVLLFAARLFRRQRWRDAVGLVFFIALQVAESLYQAVTLAILGTVYGVHLLWRHAGQLRRLAPKLLLVAALTACTAALLTGPQRHIRAVWGVLGGRIVFLLTPRQLGPGWPPYAGSVALLLAGVALVDRIRRPPADRDDPRLAYLAAGLVSAWCAVGAIALPGGTLIPSPGTLLVRAVPVLSAGRALSSIHFGITLVATFLGGVGFHCLTRACSGRVRSAVTVAVAAAALAEAFWPPLTRASFETTAELRAYAVRPNTELLHLYEATPQAPLLDLPPTSVNPFLAPEYLVLGAFHARPIATCYRAFRVLVADEVGKIVARLPAREASDALYALGFRSLVVHGDGPGRAWIPRLAPLLADGSRLREIGRAGPHVAYRLDSPLPIVASFAPLAAGAGGATDTVAAFPPETEIAFRFRNGTSAIYRHPTPIEPTRLAVRWQTPSGEVIASQEVRLLLPAALGPFEETTRPVKIPIPAPSGDYDVSLVPAEAPGLVIGRRRVHVGPDA